MKYGSLSKDGNTYLSIGGDIRYQYFFVHNEDWGESPKDDDGYLLTRFLAHADLHAGNRFRTFIQLQSSLSNGSTSPPSGADENQLDLHQGFIDIVPILNERNNLTVRIGRQEFSYGSQRLVSVREGPNNRQSFDAAKLIYAKRNLAVDLFFSHYVQSKQNIFDDGFNRNTKFWGTYFVLNQVPTLQNIDIYYFGLRKNLASFDDGKGREVRHSLGTRIWRRSDTWQYDFEGLYQFGRFAGKKISAWTISSNTAYRFSTLKFKPEIGLKTELISGDKKYNDDRLESFNPLFPRGGYFGLAAIIGPTNLADIHPSISFELSKKTDLSFDCDIFWRFSNNDGIYAPSTQLIYSGKNTSESFIGQQYATELTFTPNQFLYFRVEFTWFKAQEFLKASGPGKDILFAGFTSQLRF